jgi:hypothetical protein
MKHIFYIILLAAITVGGFFLVAGGMHGSDFGGIGLLMLLVGGITMITLIIKGLIRICKLINRKITNSK